MLVCTAEEGEARRERSPGGAYFTSRFIGTKSDAPHSLLVECDPAWVIRPHYHDIAQYQVVMCGGGTLGKHELAPGVVQYADAHTPYGPIEAGSEGLSFFVLRESAEEGRGHIMPESQAQ